MAEAARPRNDMVEIIIGREPYMEFRIPVALCLHAARAVFQWLTRVCDFFEMKSMFIVIAKCMDQISIPYNIKI